MDDQKWSGKKLKNSNSVGYTTDALCRTGSCYGLPDED